jgi:riboflavin synthase
VAVQGVCLTVTAAREREFDCNVLDETVARTSLAARPAGARLNLERALRPSDRLGGHIVNGHVDDTGVVASVGKQGADRVIDVRCAAALLTQVAPKGSVALDGVSLTVVRVTDRGFTVHIIPHTWEHTSLEALKAGDTVNIETDVLAKYVCRCVEAGSARPGGGVSVELLARSGFPLS